MYTKETEWRTLEGEFIKIKDLDNIHLANIIYHVEQGYGKYDNRNELLQVLQDEFQLERGLSLSLIKDAPYPYRDENGYWCFWNHDTGEKEGIPDHYVWIPKELLSNNKQVLDKCECGAEKTNNPNCHTTWCPKYRKVII